MHTSLGVFFWPSTLLQPGVIQSECSRPAKHTHTDKPFGTASQTYSACFQRGSQLLGREQRAAGEIWIATSNSSQNLLSLGKPMAMRDSGSCRQPLQSWSLPVGSFWLPVYGGRGAETYRNAWAESPPHEGSQSTKLPPFPHCEHTQADATKNLLFARKLWSRVLPVCLSLPAKLTE